MNEVTRSATRGNPQLMEEVRRTHRDLSGPAARLLDLTDETPEINRGSDYRKSPELPEYIRNYSFRFQTWPVLVGPEKLRQLERTTVGVVRLVKEIPQRMLDGDPRRLAEVFGLRSPLMASVLLEPPRGLDEAIARCDVVDTGDALKVVEVNVGANIGGWQHRYWQRICRSNPNLRPIFAETSLRYRDPIRILFEHIAAHGKATLAPDGEVNTFIGFDLRDLPVVEADGPALRALYDEVLEAAGCWGELSFGIYDELKVGSGLLVENRAGTRLHALVDCCTDDIPLEIVRCFKGGTINLFNGPLATVLATKKSLALLAGWAESDELDEEERRLIHECVPWSRAVAPGRVRWRDGEGEMRDVLLEAREQLVLKPQRGAQGEGVTVGAFTDPDRWKSLVHKALEEGRWLAQEFVASRPYLLQHGESSAAVFDAVWGTFCFGARYAGTFVRAIPRDADQSGVINSARGAEEAIVFEVDGM